MSSANIVMFAIQAGLKLYGASRQAYVDNTVSRELTLPLPRSPGITVSSAIWWFTEDEEGRRCANRKGNERILDLIDLYNNNKLDSEKNAEGF